MSAPKPQPTPGPLVLLLKSAALFYAAYWLERTIVEEPFITLIVAVLRIAAILIALKASGAVFRVLFGVFKVLRSWRRSTLKGSSALLTQREALKAGLHRKGKHGRFVGVLRNIAIWEASETHQLIIGPAGTQKSTAGFFNALCSLNHSALVNDTKKELYHVTAAFRRRFFGHEIAVLDPEDPETSCVNVLDTLAQLIDEVSPMALTFARAMAKQLKPDPPRPDQNAYFTGGARTLLTNLSCVIASVCMPEHRNFATLFKALTDPDFLHELLDQGMASDALNGAVSELASSVHAMAFADDDRTYQQFRTGA
ncbi:MAG: type IV secretory system conjugative DNA transfer family protein [Pseudomonadota bacterium]